MLFFHIGGASLGGNKVFLVYYSFWEHFGLPLCMSCNALDCNHYPTSCSGDCCVVILYLSGVSFYCGLNIMNVYFCYGVVSCFESLDEFLISSGCLKGFQLSDGSSNGAPSELERRLPGQF